MSFKLQSTQRLHKVCLTQSQKAFYFLYTTELFQPALHISHMLEKMSGVEPQSEPIILFGRLPQSPVFLQNTLFPLRVAAAAHPVIGSLSNLTCFPEPQGTKLKQRRGRGSCFSGSQCFSSLQLLWKGQVRIEYECNPWEGKNNKNAPDNQAPNLSPVQGHPAKPHEMLKLERGRDTCKANAFQHLYLDFCHLSPQRLGNAF